MNTEENMQWKVILYSSSIYIVRTYYLKAVRADIADAIAKV
jgi:hypothetical protein